VDTSKNASHGRILENTEDIYTHHLHLIRDPRACIFSWQRKSKKAPNGESLGTRSVSLAASKWVQGNMLADRLRRISRSNQILYYEQFVRHHPAVCRDIVARVDNRQPDLNFLNKEPITVTETHSVRGNPNRRARSITVKEDLEWLDALNVWNRRFTTLATLPFMLKYGYLRVGFGRGGYSAA
jgi:hypothetical protein